MQTVWRKNLIIFQITSSKTWQWLDYSLDHTTICGKGETHNITSGQLQYLLLGRLFRIFGTKPRYNPRRPSRAMIPVREQGQSPSIACVMLVATSPLSTPSNKGKLRSQSKSNKNSVLSLISTWNGVQNRVERSAPHLHLPTNGIKWVAHCCCK